MRQVITASIAALTPAIALAGACDPATQFPDPPVILPAGDETAGVASGDFNGDGIPDLAATNANDSTVTTWLGAGDGTFLPNGVLPTGKVPVGIASDDLNGDARADLIVTNLFDGTVGVYLANADGTFVPMATLPSAEAPFDVSTGDVNADGTADIVCSDQGTGGIVVHLGNGDGTFQPAASFPAGNFIEALTLADLNGDGALDVVVANTITAGAVRILLGNGDGTFQPSTIVDTAARPQDVKAGDLNGDGFLDLATVMESGDVVSIALGNGDGTFAASTQIPMPQDPYALALVDVSGDGTLDMVVASRVQFVSGDTLAVLHGNGDGTFQAMNVFDTGNFPFDIIAEDFDGDGAPDLAIAHRSSDDVRVFRNLCGPFNPVLATQPTSAVADEGTDAQFAVMDVDNDPLVSFQWRLDGVPLTDGPGVSGAQTVTLMLTGVDADDEGAYDVVATNAFGSTTSNPAVLAVRTTDSCPGDADGSTTVDFNDLVATLFLFGPCPE